MIVQALVGYYEARAAQGNIVRPGWTPQKVSYSLDLSRNGEILSVTPRFREEQRGKKIVEVPLVMEVPERVVRSSGISSNFLCENAAYLLGWDQEGKPGRTNNCFLACKALHLSLLEGVEGEAAAGIRAFFERWEPQSAQDNPVLAPELPNLAGVNLALMVEGVFAHLDPDIRAVWDAAHGGGGEAAEKEVRCLITGETAPFARIHGKVKLIGAQSSGANLISINADAFESYALKAGRNSAMGKYAAFAYTTALNDLLSDRKHRKLPGDDTVVYWSEDGVSEYQDTMGLVFFPEPDENIRLDEVMGRLMQGKSISPSLDMNRRFYILCLSPNAARISVRFFHQDTFGNLLEHCRAHYERLRIVSPPQAQKYLSPYWLTRETVNPKSSDKKPSPLLTGAVLHSILAGSRYPGALFHAILTRIRADQTVNWRRAAILKAWLLRNTSVKEEELTVDYNPDFDHPAYVLGALFSVLEKLQESANGSATIRGRYFTSAGTTPGNVFPTLLRLSTHHLAKLDKPGLKIYYNREIGTLMDKLQPANGRAFPAYLDQNGQGLFYLGYYHRNQARYAGKQKEEA